MSKKLCFNTTLIYFVVLAVFVLVRICSNCGLFSFMGDYASYIMGFITQVGIIFLLPLLCFKILNKISFKNTFKFFTYKKVSWKTVVVSICLGAVVFLINIYVSNFFNSAIQFFGYKPASSGGSELPATWWVLVLNLITTAVLPAICEETLHRGMLLKGVSQMGIKKSVIISGLLFGLLHLNIEQVFYASLIGLFLGYLCWCCDSIYPCMIIHFMNNALSVILSFASAKGWAIGSVLNKLFAFLTQTPFIGFLMVVLFLCLLLMIAGEMTKFLIKDSFNYNFGKRQKELTNMAIRENYFKQIDDIKNDRGEVGLSFSTEKKVIYIDFRDFLEFVRKNMDDFKKDDEKSVAEAEKKGLSQDELADLNLKTKILLYGSFVLSSVVTIMTFIWGLLR